MNSSLQTKLLHLLTVLGSVFLLVPSATADFISEIEEGAIAQLLICAVVQNSAALEQTFCITPHEDLRFEEEPDPLPPYIEELPAILKKQRELIEKVLKKLKSRELSWAKLLELYDRNKNGRLDASELEEIIRYYIPIWVPERESIIRTILENILRAESIFDLLIGEPSGEPREDIDAELIRKWIEEHLAAMRDSRQAIQANWDRLGCNNSSNLTPKIRSACEILARILNELDKTIKALQSILDRLQLPLDDEEREITP